MGGTLQRIGGAGMLATVSISPLWYISRSAGFVGLALLGMIGILGIITAGKFTPKRGSRFLAPEIHRSLSLLAVVVLAIHVASAVLDKYSHIGFRDIFVPFVSQYRPVWVGLGAAAVDLGIAIMVTSLLRVRMGYKSWKLVHWASYPIFVLSVIHGLGTGSDSAITLGKAIYLIVGGSFILAVLARLMSAKVFGARRALLYGTSFAMPLVVVAWAFSGPFTNSWTKRASGNFLGSAAGASVGVTTPTVPVLAIPPGYSSPWSGRIDQSAPNSQGEVALRLIGPLSGSPGYQLSIVLIGVAEDGGISMNSSRVEIATGRGTPVYRGTVTSLQGATIASQITTASGSQINFTAVLSLNNNGSAFSGKVSVS